MLFAGYSRSAGTKTTLADLMDIAALWGVAPEDVVIEVMDDGNIEVDYTVPLYADPDGCVLCRKIGHDSSEPCQP
ncbi:MAG TPA: hypothetical protein VIY48_18355 [Candidatus Paceibacterota bacterium]